MKSTAIVALSLFVVLISSGSGHAHEIQVYDFYNHPIGYVEHFTDCGMEVFNTIVNKYFGIDNNSNFGVYTNPVWFTSTNCTTGPLIPTSLKDQNSWYRFISDDIVSFQPIGSPYTTPPTPGSWASPAINLTTGLWETVCESSGTPPSYPTGTAFTNITINNVPAAELDKIHYKGGTWGYPFKLK